MISDEDRDLILRMLGDHSDNLIAEKRKGCPDFHFCHPKQLEYVKRMDIEIAECERATRIVEELE